MRSLSADSLAVLRLLNGCVEQFDETPLSSNSSSHLLLKRAATPTTAWLLGNPDALEGTWKPCRSIPSNQRGKPPLIDAGLAHERVLMLDWARALGSLKQ
ncbi:hypothetical protein SAMN04515666_108230 [Bosea lupini]|uniref:Uncharacterized protein n=1 Tax=Bosea lupini TaxID=1036779 RepID=A0A1H7WKV3_9HYPH|nr:hypothetical protein [Bosea lupini]SEM22206.1 hypothetical protein SAMN04515666_108230 [Bosea lupini]